MTRALVVCPGRGSYGRQTLGSLAGRSPAASDVIARCDAWREAHGRLTVSELDASKTFLASKHLAGENASLLTFAASMADLVELSDAYEVVGVTGNSMGWYTALAASGALSLDDAIRLVDTMGEYQRDKVVGGQLMWPLTDADWAPDPGRRQTVSQALTVVREAGHGAWWSIDLGSFAVLGADDEGCKALTAALPEESRGERSYPVRLPKHAAFHTPLMQPTSDRARGELAALRLRPPTVPLVDGRGRVFRPRWAHLDELFDYTLGHQVVRPYDFTYALRTALHHTAPDVVVLLGPGNALGGPVAATMVADDWRGCGTRVAFEAANADDPFLLSFGREAQRAALTG